MKTVLVIGGGASGMAAAAFAKNESTRVVLLEKNEKTDAAVEQFNDYICNETLATITKVDTLEGVEAEELVEGINVKLKIQKK